MKPWIFTCLIFCVMFLICPRIGDPAVSVQHPFGRHQTSYQKGFYFPDGGGVNARDQATVKFYEQWKTRYLKAGCGKGRFYVYVNADGGKDQSGWAAHTLTISEAMGYGLLIEVLMAGVEVGSQERFNGLFYFFRDHPSRNSSALMAWNQVEGCGNAVEEEADSATDGDLDAAYALLLAAQQWGSAGPVDYLAEANRLLQAIRQKEIHDVMGTPLLGDFVSPDQSEYYNAARSSDFMTSHFRAFNSLDPVGEWAETRDSVYRLLEKVQNPTTGLVPDFITGIINKPRAARSNFLETREDGQYSFNACRVPLRLSLDYLGYGDKRAEKAVKKLNSFFRRQTAGDPLKIYAGYRLSGRALNSDSHLAFTAPLLVASMLEDENGAEWRDSLWTAVEGTALEDSDYYGNTIKLLSMIAASGNWWFP